MESSRHPKSPTGRANRNQVYGLFVCKLGQGLMDKTGQQVGPIHYALSKWQASVTLPQLQLVNRFAKKKLDDE